MNPSLALWAILLTTCLGFIAPACKAEITVEPYSSKPTAAEMAFIGQWKTFLLKQGKADARRYVADLPFSFRCGDRSSREWVRIETANIQSGDWQKDKSRLHTLTWKDAKTALVCEMKLTEFSRHSRFPMGCFCSKRRQERLAESARFFWNRHLLECDGRRHAGFASLGRIARPRRRLPIPQRDHAKLDVGQTSSHCDG